MLKSGGVEAKPKSFNRYMVECEYVNWSEVYKNANRFNRYMVECEYQF